MVSHSTNTNRIYYPSKARYETTKQTYALHYSAVLKSSGLYFIYLIINFIQNHLWFTMKMEVQTTVIPI